MTIKQLLEYVVSYNASDLHLVNEAYPMVRIDGSLKAIPQTSVLDEAALETLVLSMLTENQKAFFKQNKELDFSLALGSKARFRVNVYIQRGTMSAALRLIPAKIKTIEELGLPKSCYNFTKLKAGMVLVTGPTGHGKSSTLAAIINEINKTRAEHIMTIEDPIEYTYKNQMSIVTQREIGQDTHSFKIALKSILREDPDVVLIGEMRDYETIAAALTIAETGHLVFATLHTNSAAQTIDRIVDVFPAHQQNQVRMQLSNALESIVSQRLLPAIGGGRVPVMEILMANTAVKTNIREAKTHLIDNIIQTSQDSGMLSLEASMAELVKANKLSIEVAKPWSSRPNDLMRLLGN